MKKLFVIGLACLCCGCMNLYTRCPGTNPRIERVYQSSGNMMGLALIVSFPQMMSDGPSNGFMIENLITIPCGILVAADGLCEFVLDTALLPIDYTLAKSRKGKLKSHDCLLPLK